MKNRLIKKRHTLHKNRIPDYYTESELFDEINAIYNIFDETSETFKKYIRYVYKNEAPRTSNGSYWDPVQFQCYLFALGVSEITTDTLSTIYPVQESGEGVLYPYYATSSNRTKLKSDGTEFTGDELMAGKGYWGLRMIHHETNSIGQNANAYYGVFWNSGSISDNATYINLVFAFCIGKSTV